MKKFMYTQEELNDAVYQCQTVEKEYQKAKDEYDILDDSAKDVLAQIKHRILSAGNVSNADAETKARADVDWKTFKDGLYAAKRTLGQNSLKMNHALRVLNAITSGLAFRRELVKKNVEQA